MSIIAVDISAIYETSGVSAHAWLKFNDYEIK